MVEATDTSGEVLSVCEPGHEDPNFLTAEKWKGIARNGPCLGWDGSSKTINVILAKVDSVSVLGTRRKIHCNQCITSMKTR